MQPAAGAKPRSSNLQIATYFGLGYLFYHLCTPTGGFPNIVLQWLLKNRLALGPRQLATFQLVIAAPACLAFVFGLARDRWNRLGHSDRSLFWIFAPVAAIGYLWLATGEPTWLRLLIGILAISIAYRFLTASLKGLAAAVGQHHALTGRLSSLTNIAAALMSALSWKIGGYLTDRLPSSELFLILALATLTLFALGFWKPRAIYSGSPRAPQGADHLGRDLRRLLAHRPLRPAALIWVLWAFSPAAGAALLFYMTDHLHGTATQFGDFNAVFNISFVPTFVLYGFLCRRASLRALLLWGTLIAVPQMVPLVFLRSAAQAVWMAAPMGLAGGIATAAYTDLLMRSCPRGLEGTGMMVAEAFFFISVRLSDVFGAWLYEHGGFALAAWMTAAVYSLLIPVVLLVPRSITQSPDQAAPNPTPTSELTLA